MVDKGKLIKALEICIKNGDCYTCPYYTEKEDCTNALRKDSLILLKKAQPKWVPVSLKNPLRSGAYWVTDYKDVWECLYFERDEKWYQLMNEPPVLAWMVKIKPEPPKSGIFDDIVSLREIPAAEVEPVIRCKECVHGCPEKGHEPDVHCSWWDYPMPPMGFCCKAMRKKGEE